MLRRSGRWSVLNRVDQTARLERRTLRLYILIVFGLFALMTVRLLFLQVMSWEELRLRSINNIIQAVPTPAPRGNIFDRAGQPLAVNVSVHRLLYKPPVDIAQYYPTDVEKAELKAKGQQPLYLHRETGRALDEVHRLGAYLGLPYDELMRKLEKELKRLNGSSLYGYKPATLVNNLSFPQVAYLEEHREEYQGFFIDNTAFERQYPLGERAAHLLGYTGLASDSDKDFIKKMGFTIQEKVGKDGVEMQFEALLHGNQGRRNIEVDRNRIFQEIVSEVQPEKGTDIYLTIDRDIQARAHNALAGRRGAVIVACLAEGHEGEIIALTSGPSFDPYQINNYEYFKPRNEDTRNRPLTNRAIRGSFFPGSTFKLVTGAACLQSNTIEPTTSWGCGGFLDMGRKDRGGRRFHCHWRPGHGPLTFGYAMAKSCDVYFYRSALSLKDPPGQIAEFAREFGYGEPTGIELYDESSGFVPTRQWRIDAMKKNGYPKSDQNWFKGDTLNYAIGQGDVKATPMQVLWSAAIVAWRGERYPPQLLYAHSASTGIVKEPRKRPTRTRLDPDVLAVIEDGMRKAVTDGTCAAFKPLGLGVCAKTGTAETGRGTDHAWVVGYWPQKEPKYAFVALVEHGGHGAEAAVPGMKELVKYIADNDPLEAREQDAQLARR
jgi:penicillin-binding protein 2